MILHCTPPYEYYIPNAALGYLKGFLKSNSIPVKSVYWNLVLFQEIKEFQERIGTYPLIMSYSPNYIASFYITRHLLMENSHSQTPLNVFLSSLFTEEKVSALLHTFKDKIDTYILDHNLHKESLAGFTLKTHQWLMSHYIMGRLKEMNPDINIVIGGITNKEQGRAFLDVLNHADYAVYGEGEYPLYYLIEALKEGTDLKKVPSLVYRKKNNTEWTEKYTGCPDLNEYPFADHTEYFETLKQVTPGNMPVLIPIWGSRSCPWNKCKFCVVNEEYTYRTRSPENILEEIEYQVQNHGVDHIVFVDSEFAGNKKRFKTLLKLLVQSAEKRGAPYHFFAEASPVFIDAEAAALMQRASFDLIQTGFEAMTDSLLEKIQKRQKFAYNIQILKLGNQYDINIKGNVMKGIPPETRDDVLESCENLKFLRFLLKNYPVLPNFFALYKNSGFDIEMSEEEKRHWNEDILWEEVASLHLIPEEDKFEFFGFYKDRLRNHLLWDTFGRLLRIYGEKKSSYTWTDYNGYSVFEETGSRDYTCELTKDETDILVFCDSVKKFSEITSVFPRIPEESLKKILKTLKDAALLYYDKDMTMVISVLDVYEKNSAG
jgi:radical SAM superfamily enzyme YgiQ (UPF0313 family)